MEMEMEMEMEWTAAVVGQMPGTKLFPDGGGGSCEGSVGVSLPPRTVT